MGFDTNYYKKFGYCFIMYTYFNTLWIHFTTAGQNISRTATVHAVILWTAWNGRLQLVYTYQKKIHICTGSHMFMCFLPKDA
jgi:hypothetical protein